MNTKFLVPLGVFYILYSKRKNRTHHGLTENDVKVTLCAVNFDAKIGSANTVPLYTDFQPQSIYLHRMTSHQQS